MSEMSVPRGFRDFPREVMILRKRVFSIIEDVFKSFGFDPIDTPAVEYLETLSGKYGEEAENKLMWKFKDPWSDRWYALRYDLTVPMARFIAQNRHIPMPFKRYHIAPVWRHEEPQRGRYREFYQCDVDIVGSPYPEADAEILEVIWSVFKRFNLESVRIHLNDRRILRGLFEEELKLDNPMPVYRAIDKLDKIGVEGVARELERLGLSQGVISKILTLIDLKGDPLDVVRKLRERYVVNKSIVEGSNFIEEMLNYLPRDIKILYDMALVRGLDYYTGPIFEVEVDKPRIGSLAGGGRYDDLIQMFVGEKIPATGGSIGVERLIDAGLELGLFNLDKKTYTDVYLILMNRDQDTLSYGYEIARRLREKSFNVALDLMRRSVSKQREYARKLSIPVLLFVGEIELRNRSVTIYITSSGERREIRIDDLESELRKILEK
ncbi:MAG: histidine--tRNA ligase [Sulfolobales archaeon]